MAFPGSNALPLLLWVSMTMSLPKFLELPDDLMVMILKYIVPTGRTINDYDFSKKLLSTSDRNCPKSFPTDVLPLLIAIPAMKDFVYDVLFTENKISLSPDEDCSLGSLAHDGSW